MYSSFNARAVGLTLSAAETIEIASQAGFAGVDLLVRDLVDAGESPKLIRRRMDDAGLQGGAFPLPVAWRGDASTFEADLATLPKLAEVSAELGLLRTGTWVMPERLPGDTSTSFEATLGLHIDRLGRIADVLGRSGIAIGLEVIGVERSRSGGTPRFLTRLGELASIRAPLGDRPNVGLLLDTFHLYAADEPLDDALKGGMSSIVWVHVADLPEGSSPARSLILDHERGLPRPEGTIDNRAVLQALDAGGYAGPVTVEPLARCERLQGKPALEIAKTVAESLRSVWPGGPSASEVRP